MPEWARCARDVEVGMVRRVVVSLIALFLSLVLLVMGNGLLGTLLSVRLELEGFEPAMAWLVLAMFSVGYVAGSLYGIRVVERVGHVRAFAAFGAVGRGRSRIRRRRPVRRVRPTRLYPPRS
jgi:hypothetical protein